jgi:hypothetical protein
MEIIQKEIDVKYNNYENENINVNFNRIKIKRGKDRIIIKKRIVPNQIIDFLNNNINIYEKYEYGISIEVPYIYRMIIDHIKYYDLYENKYIICNRPLAKMLNLDTGDSILFVNFYKRLCKLYKNNEYEKLGME